MPPPLQARSCSLPSPAMKAPTIPFELLSARPLETQATTTESTTEDGAQQAKSSAFDSMLLPMAACFLVFWFIVIRPEKRQRKEREAMLGALKKGDEVITSGGIHGRVAQVKGDVVTVQVADGVRLRISLAAVQNKVTDDEPEETSDDEAANTQDDDRNSD